MIQPSFEPIKYDLSMKSCELIRMAERDGGHLRNICRVLASCADASHDFRLVFALNEAVLFSKGKFRAQARERLCETMPEVMAAVEKASADREALVQHYADRGEDGQILLVAGEGDTPSFRVSGDGLLEEFGRKEQEVVDGFQQAVAVLTDPLSAGRPASLKAFDEAVLRVRVCRVPWAEVPASVGGGMLLAALPFFDGVPEAVVKEARRLRDMESARTADTVESILSWQGVADYREGDGSKPAEGPDTDGFVPALPPFMMRPCNGTSTSKN